MKILIGLLILVLLSSGCIEQEVGSIGIPTHVSGDELKEMAKEEPEPEPEESEEEETITTEIPRPDTETESEPLVEERKQKIDRRDPMIKIRTPWDNGNSTEIMIWLEGTIEDASEIVNSTYRINNGEGKILFGTDGIFSIQIVLVEGENIISVYAEDSFGNNRTKTVTITYSPPPPPAPVLNSDLRAPDSTIQMPPCSPGAEVCAG